MNTVLKEKSRFLRSFDRIGIVVLSLATLGFMDNISEGDIIAGFLLEIMMIILGVALVLLLAMDVFEFIDIFVNDTEDIEVQKEDYALSA